MGSISCYLVYDHMPKKCTNITTPFHRSGLLDEAGGERQLLLGVDDELSNKLHGTSDKPYRCVTDTIPSLHRISGQVRFCCELTTS